MLPKFDSCNAGSRFTLSVLGLAVFSVIFLVSFPISGLGQDAGVTFNGVGLKIADETVPPGGMLQLKVFVTEPKPIMKARQMVSFTSTSLGTARGINLFSPAGDVSGVAVSSGKRMKFYINSPLSTLGTDPDYPVLTMAIPVRPTAVPGQQVNLTLDSSLSSWFDPALTNYPVELQSGVLTVGGTLSISNVFPGSGVVPAGTAISISGKAFQPSSQVKVKEATVATSQFVSANQIRFTLTTALDMESKQVQVKNPSTNETATYYSYQRPAILGTSAHLLVAKSYALFARSTWKLGYFRPVLSGTVFSGLALQNLSSTGATVQLDLLSKPGGTVIARQSVALAANSRITRDLREFFPSVSPASGTELRMTSPIPVQMLGLAGDDSTGIVLGVDPSPIP